jgi:hypothetical protein
LAFGSIAAVKRLVLFHHDPLHTDAVLDVMAERAAAMWTGAGTVEMAFEGMEIDLSGDRAGEMAGLAET